MRDIRSYKHKVELSVSHVSIATRVNAVIYRKKQAAVHHCLSVQHDQMLHMILMLDTSEQPISQDNRSRSKSHVLLSVSTVGVCNLSDAMGHNARHYLQRFYMGGWVGITMVTCL